MDNKHNKYRWVLELQGILQTLSLIYREYVNHAYKMVMKLQKFFTGDLSELDVNNKIIKIFKKIIICFIINDIIIFKGNFNFHFQIRGYFI